MSKRNYDSSVGEKDGHSHKKYRHDAERGLQTPSPTRKGYGAVDHDEDAHAPVSNEDTAMTLPEPSTTMNSVPAYKEFTVKPGLPKLPSILDDSLSDAPFRHKSTLTYDKTLVDPTKGDQSYERLEFLGDSYLHLIATRLIYSRFPHLPTGQMSQLRELLVKNETLCEFGRGYGFDQRVQATDMHRMQAESRNRGNKGMNKIIGDVFEAYLASVILSRGDDGFAVAEKWLTALWTPKITLAVLSGAFSALLPAAPTNAAVAANPAKTYDPAAKSELQRRIQRGPDVKLEYIPTRPAVELKGYALGQNRHYIAVRLNGYGYKHEVLGVGEGKNKFEAGNWAAMDAMYGRGKDLVDECEEKANAAKEARAEAKAAKEAKEA